MEKLAQLFRDRTNPLRIAITIGEVVQLNPLKVQWGDKVLLDTAHHLVVNRIHADGFTVQYDDNGTAKTITIVDPLAVGDQVMLVPDDDLKQWFLIGKVGVIT